MFFNFVFASEEYLEFANSAFNDAFALFIDGMNVALVPTTTTPISINSINNTVNNQFYNDNEANIGPFFDELGYDGFTDVFMAQATGLDTTATHTVKMAISDVTDQDLGLRRLYRSWYLQRGIPAEINQRYQV